MKDNKFKLTINAWFHHDHRSSAFVGNLRTDCRNVWTLNQLCCPAVTFAASAHFYLLWKVGGFSFPALLLSCSTNYFLHVVDRTDTHHRWTSAGCLFECGSAVLLLGMCVCKIRTDIIIPDHPPTHKHAYTDILYQCILLHHASVNLMKHGDINPLQKLQIYISSGYLNNNNKKNTKS